MIHYTFPNKLDPASIRPNILELENNIYLCEIRNNQQVLGDQCEGVESRVRVRLDLAEQDRRLRETDLKDLLLL